MDNEQIADQLHQIADLMELADANGFKIKAYRRGASAIRNMELSAVEAIADGSIAKMRGIGKSLLKKLQELVDTGTISYLDQLREELPPGLFQMQKIPGLGPKRIKVIWSSLGVDSVKKLEKACKDGRVAGLPRFGDKLVEQILDEIEHLGVTSVRRPREEVIDRAHAFRDHFLAMDTVIEGQIAGSLRRGKPTVKDVDLLVSSLEPERVMAAAREYPCHKIIASGNTKTSLRLEDGLQVDIRVVAPESFACALAYFTGSKDFNVRLRGLALDKGYSLNEYALRPLDGSEPPAIANEVELHALLGLEYIPAEQRETDVEILKQLGKG